MPEKKRKAVEAVLPDGRSVVVAELGLGEVKHAMQLASREKAEQARALETAVQGLRLSIRKIGDRSVTYSDLEGVKFEEFFDVRETMLLADVWNDIHLPTDEQRDSVRGKTKAMAG
jgi:hypothetical protein